MKMESITQRQTSVPMKQVQQVQQQPQLLRNHLEIQIGYAPISTQTATFTGYF